MSCISHQRYGRTGIFTDLCGIHVNMHQHLVAGDQLRLVHSPVRHSGSHHNQKLRLVHGPVGIGLSVISHHSEIQRVIRGHDSDSHHGGNHGNLMLFAKCLQLLFRAGEKDPSSGADNWTLCLCKLSGHLLDLYHIAFYGRLVGAHGDRLGISEFLNLRVLNINGNVD